ncbi:unnamed protein product [Lupinus luteus]|uniref:Uncharacterized protein n=1 Tax=Lupinus luteus TaxID=3873 RepID=A0AAV1W6W7_LUPLU
MLVGYHDSIVTALLNEFLLAQKSINMLKSADKSSKKKVEQLFEDHEEEKVIGLGQGESQSLISIGQGGIDKIRKRFDKIRKRFDKDKKRFEIKNVYKRGDRKVWLNK